MKGGAHKRRGIEGVQDDTVGVIASMKDGARKRRACHVYRDQDIWGTPL
ncbi:hypothetical protein [Microbispora rosea]